MYSTTISPRGVRSDGQLHGHRAPPPKPAPAPPAPPAPSVPPAKPVGLSAEQILIGVIAYLLLQNEKPDWMLVLAMVYILF